MYFVIIMAFALVLSEKLPPEGFSLIPFATGNTVAATLGIVLLQIPVVALMAGIGATRTMYRIDGTDRGHNAAADELSFFQHMCMVTVAGFLVTSMIFTPWARVVRETWNLDRFPLLPELVLLGPMMAGITIGWAMSYRAEESLREDFAREPEGPEAEKLRDVPPQRDNDAMSALRSAKKRPPEEGTSLFAYLFDKMRHQVLILAVPMCVIVTAKHFLYAYADGPGDGLIPLPKDPTTRMLIVSCMLGTVSFLVLALAPVMLRYIWATEPLPDGPLRKRFERICDRIGLRYREILLWHTHGTAVNAAVMGFIAPIRYILVSDALLESMKEEEIEAVFGHEAGHVRHWHLPFFGIFAIVSMYAAGGAMILASIVHAKFFQANGEQIDQAIIQLIALVTLLGMWLFGFSWLSRRFERQADLYGVRCITPDIRQCQARLCPVHGAKQREGLCIGATNLFGHTLTRIAELNNIPKDAFSWRHGSIQSRCNLLDRFKDNVDALRRFDTSILYIKLALLSLTILGTVVAVWIYYEPVMRGLGMGNPTVTAGVS